LAPDGENIERANRARGLAAVAQVFAEPSNVVVFGGLSAAVILIEGGYAVDELGQFSKLFLNFQKIRKYTLF
jgi:hypothetical protein